MLLLKYFVGLTLCAALAFQPFTVFAASSFISSVTRLDTSEGSIKSDSADYTFVLPKSWQGGSVTVNREHPSQGSQFVDKLIFLYIPIDKISKPAIFATLYVYENTPGINTEGSRKLLETDKYIFTFDSATRNNFSDVADRSLFNSYMSSASNDSIMSSQIEVPKTQRRITANTVIVNGKMLKESAIQNINGAVYIPIRATCSALGYNVDWNPSDSSITISSDNGRYLISTPNSPFKYSYSAIILNDKAYIGSIFFMLVLNANIEVDSSNNVVINTN